jgi:hypothetical protein
MWKTDLTYYPHNNYISTALVENLWIKILSVEIFDKFIVIYFSTGKFFNQTVEMWKSFFKRLQTNEIFHSNKFYVVEIFC